MENSTKVCIAIKKLKADAEFIFTGDIITEAQFNKIDWATISKIMLHPAWLFDTRSFKNSSKANDYGINVWMLGNGLKE